MALNKPGSESLSERDKRNLVILEMLRRLGPITRPEISQTIGLNIVTVSNYIEDFLDRKLVFEKEFDVSEGGRRPMLLDINPDAGYCIGIGLNLLNIVGVLMDFKGRVINRYSIERDGGGIQEIIKTIVQLAAAIINKSAVNKDRIKGIGVGIAGIVNKANGSVRWPQKIDNNYNYVSVCVPLKDLLEKEFGLPVLIENDATAAAFGEQWIALKTEIRHLIYMFSGVGCGIMINGEIFTGATGGAGEISIYNTKEEKPFFCWRGSPCFLKRWEIDFGIVEQAKAALFSENTDNQVSIRDSKIREHCANDPDKLNLKAVFQAVRQNDSFAAALLSGAAARLGIRVAYLVNLLNPQMVVIGGGFEEAGDLFLNTVRSTVDEWAFEEMAKNVRIIYSALGENAVACGASSLMMRQAFIQDR